MAPCSVTTELDSRQAGHSFARRRGDALWAMTLLSHEMQVWNRYVSGGRPGPRLARWSWGKLTVLAMPVWVVLAVARVGLSTSLPDFLACMCGLLPQYSAGTAAFLLVRRNDRLAALLHRVCGLAEDVEGHVQGHVDADPAQARVAWRMRRNASLVRYARRAVAVYMPGGMTLLVVQQLLGRPPAPTLGEESARSHALGHALLTANETLKWAFYAVSYFVFWALLASLLLALDAMYAALGQRVARAHGRLQVRAAARLHLGLLALQAELNELTFQPLLHILAGAAVVPLINTYQLLKGMANVFSFLTFSTLPVVFGTLSALGDGLEVRAEQFSLATLGSSDVFGESTGTTRLRLMLMTRAGGHQGHPVGLSMRGFGSLNLRAAFIGLSRWYQYLQLLMGAAN